MTISLICTEKRKPSFADIASAGLSKNSTKLVTKTTKSPEARSNDANIEENAPFAHLNFGSSPTPAESSNFVKSKANNQVGTKHTNISSNDRVIDEKKKNESNVWKKINNTQVEKQEIRHHVEKQDAKQGNATLNPDDIVGIQLLEKPQSHIISPSESSNENNTSLKKSQVPRSSMDMSKRNANQKGWKPHPHPKQQSSSPNSNASTRNNKSDNMKNIVSKSPEPESVTDKRKNQMKNNNWNKNKNQKNRNSVKNNRKKVQPYQTLSVQELEKLQQDVVKQVEYFFSANELVRNVYLRKQMDIEGYLPAAIIFNFPSVSSFGMPYHKLLDAISELSEKIEVDMVNECLRIKSQNEDYKKWLFPNSKGGLGCDKWIKQGSVDSEAVNPENSSNQVDEVDVTKTEQELAAPLALKLTDHSKEDNTKPPDLAMTDSDTDGDSS